MNATELFCDELTLSPARTARMLRMTSLVVLVVVTSMALRVPEVAVSGYMVFFFSQRDVGTTVKSGVAAIIGLTLAIALCFVCFLLSIAEPAVRLPLMGLLAFGGMYLMRATPAGALGTLLGFISFYALTFPDQLPSPEVLVRALLWLWVVIAYPVALLVLVDLAFGSRPEEVYRTGIAERLAAAAHFLADPAAVKKHAPLERLVRLGASDLVPYVDRGGLAIMAPVRANLLRQTELLTLLLHRLPDEIRQSETARPTLLRAAAACEGARRALLDRNGASLVQFVLLAAERRALATKTPATHAVVLPLVSCIQTVVLGVQELSAAPTSEAVPSRHAPAPKSPDDKSEAARFALKVTIAAMTAYLVYSGLEWYGIHTAAVTCFFVAQESVGASIHKLTLRLAGAIVGAGLGMLSILLVLPALESVGGLAVLVAAVTLLAAWVGTASPRIAYAGWQIAIAFYLTVLQGFSRTSKLSVGRDRIIGIVLGNILMSIVFTSLWPVRAAPAQQRTLSRATLALAAMLRTSADDRNALRSAEADFYEHLTKARQYMPLLIFERARDHRGLVTLVQGLFIPIHAIACTPLPAMASPAAHAALSSATSGVSEWLHAFAAAIASGGEAPTSRIPDAVVPLEQILNVAREPPEVLDELRLHLEWCELLHAQIGRVPARGEV